VRKNEGYFSLEEITLKEQPGRTPEKRTAHVEYVG
jgi:hypothetical protein